VDFLAKTLSPSIEFTKSANLIVPTFPVTPFFQKIKNQAKDFQIT